MEFILLVKYFKVKGKGLWRHDIVPLEFLLSRGTVYIICFPQPIYIQNQVLRCSLSKLICYTYLHYVSYIQLPCVMPVH